MARSRASPPYTNKLFPVRIDVLPLLLFLVLSVVSFFGGQMRLAMGIVSRWEMEPPLAA